MISWLNKKPIKTKKPGSKTGPMGLTRKSWSIL
jgi:hypothetical protein